MYRQDVSRSTYCWVAASTQAIFWNLRRHLEPPKRDSAHTLCRPMLPQGDVFTLWVRICFSLALPDLNPQIARTPSILPPYYIMLQVAL